MDQEEFDLEQTLVQACNFFRERLDQYPKLLHLWITAIQQYPSDIKNIEIAKRRLEIYKKRIDHIFQKTQEREPLPSCDFDAIASLRHDMSSTLTALYGNFYLFSEIRSTPTQRLEYLEASRICCEQFRMWLHVDTEEDISARQVFKLLYDYLEKELKEKGISFEPNITDARVHVIPTFTVRRFYQTVRNAIKACSLDFFPHTITIDAFVQGDFYVVDIADQGIGIYPQVIIQAARAAGITEEPQTCYGAISQIFTSGVSGFRQMNMEGTGHGLNSAKLASQGGQPVTLETTIYDSEGTLITINQEHPNGYCDPTKTTTGTTFRYYLPLAKKIIIT